MKRIGEAGFVFGLMAAVVLAAAMVSTAQEKPKLPDPLVEPGSVVRQPVDLPKPKGLILTAETYPRTSGSTSAEPLGVWVACRLLGKECHWPLHPWGDHRLLPHRKIPGVELGGNQKIDRDFYKRIRHVGTHGAYKALIEKKTDLIYECRLPSADEEALMKTEAADLDIRPVALDAFVFLRNLNNPVKNLTLEQIRGIFAPGVMKEGHRTGKIPNWKEVGGPDSEIYAYTRNRNSGSQETMNSLVMAGRPILSNRSMIGRSMGGPFNRLRFDKRGIGFTFFYYHRCMAPGSRRIWREGLPKNTADRMALDRVQMFSVNGIRPTRASIADRTYPLVTKVYLVIRKNMPEDAPAVQLRDWLLTEEGQKVVGETGYVPLPTEAWKKSIMKEDEGKPD